MRFVFQYQGLAEPIRVEPSTITLDMWWQPASVPVNRLPSLVPGGNFDPVKFPPPIAPPDVNLDSWWQPTQVPVLPPVPQIQKRSVVEPVSQDAEIVYQDAWYRAPEIPVLPRWSPVGGTTGPILDVTPAPDLWHQMLSVPVLPTKKLTPHEQPFTVDPGILAFDAWMPQYQEPVRQRRPLSTEIIFVIDVNLITPSTITLDMWYQPISLPVYRPIQVPGETVFMTVITYDPADEHYAFYGSTGFRPAMRNVTNCYVAMSGVPNGYVGMRGDQ